MDERQKDLSNYRITQADDSLKLRLRARVLQAEWERIDGAKTMSATEARKNLRERLGEL